jgi:hypothetical protein
MRMLTVCLLVIFATVPAKTLAQDVYRWTDEAGVVHYGTSPPAEKGEPVMRLTPPETGSAPGMQERLRKQQRLLEAYQRDREIKRIAAQEQAEQERRHARSCKRLTARWQELSYPGPIYFETSGGGRRYLSEEERQQGKSQLVGPLREHCGGLPE